MEHKQVRFLHPHFPKDKINEEVEREDKLVRWADAFYLNAMRMTAAATLVECDSLEKAASLLETVGFRVPAGVLSEDDYFDLDDESALRAYVEKDEEGIRRAYESIGFHLAGSGQLLDKAGKYLR
jgi:hypothetical protein